MELEGVYVLDVLFTVQDGEGDNVGEQYHKHCEDENEEGPDEVPDEGKAFAEIDFGERVGFVCGFVDYVEV